MRMRKDSLLHLYEGFVALLNNVVPMETKCRMEKSGNERNEEIEKASLDNCVRRFSVNNNMYL